MGNCFGSAVETNVHRKIERHFEDGIRKVDIILGFYDTDLDFDHTKKRHLFEVNARKEGLHLEPDFSQGIRFVKVHVPMEVLHRYAEVLKIKMPMKKLPGQEQLYDDPFELSLGVEQFYIQKENEVPTYCGRLCRPIIQSIKLSEEKFPLKEKRIYSEFQINHKNLYDAKQSNYFDDSTRSSIVYFILERTRFTVVEDTLENVGIEKLLAEGVYICAYGLHEQTQRNLLSTEWAAMRHLLHAQPLDNIKEYFGARVAMYFAWLGFYTSMLIPLSIFGLVYLLFGYSTLFWDTISKEICNHESNGIMCPSCDRYCDYWKLKDICIASKASYLIDNYGTWIYAVTTSVWAVLFLELWKRYAAKLVHKWGLTGYTPQLEHPRPEYLAKLKKIKKLSGKLNHPNHFFEPDVPFYNKCLPNVTNYNVLLSFVVISVMVSISMIVYRMAQHAASNIVGNKKSIAYTVFYFPMGSTVIELTVKIFLSKLYNGIAIAMTQWEYCRTRKEFDESVTTKNFIFHFVNYYSSLFYISFIKGKLVGYPGHYNRIFGLRREECHHGGCLLELGIQLIVTMVGKQIFFGLLEVMTTRLSIFMRWINTKKAGITQTNKQWYNDYFLLPWSHVVMYSDYLEMAIQFGFITLFGLALPLAPLFALIHNVLEIRLDAYKMIKFMQRPIAERACGIGVWLGFLTMITKLSVVSCAFLIAFSSNFITKLVYVTAVSKTGNLEGYTEFVLSHFDTEHFDVQPLLTNKSQHLNVKMCRYWDFRNPPWSENSYERPMIYWQILAAKLVFVVIYQNFIGFVQTVISWSIPNVPHDLQKRIDREHFLLREFIIEYEKLLALQQRYEHESSV